MYFPNHIDFSYYSGLDNYYVSEPIFPVIR